MRHSIKIGITIMLFYLLLAWVVVPIWVGACGESPVASREECSGCGGYEGCTWDVESGGWYYH